ncbi:MAG: PCMD domain-containing protein [Bacteroidaceae bacterium]|nr:PCMD domain-containing protein [Bacteroidaceae bacterium]
MKKTSIFAFVAVPLLLASCIAAEQDNTECDIEEVSLHLDSPIDFFFHEYDTLQTVISTETDIVFTIRSYANIQSVPLSLRITEGASIYMISEDGTETPFLSGSPVDFSNEKVYHFRVVSEDKVWSRNYSISVVHDKPSEGNLFIDYESYHLDASGKYFVWDAPEVFPDATWKNGNPGFKISKSSAKPMDYPSTPAVGAGPDGSDCVKLETCDTGPFGRMANMRLASGSMFNGIFDVGNALTAPLEATLMGSPYTHKPIQVRIWLRYEQGSVFQDRDGKLVEGVVDEPDFYIVFYRNEDAEGNKVQLNGGDILTNPNIVGLGRLPHHYNSDGSDQLSNDPIHGVTDEWQEFTIPVVYRSEIDATILENQGYSIAFGSASSWQGGYFAGAIGSKLYMDNLQLFCE